jgi:hypothetical protein
VVVDSSHMHQVVCYTFGVSDDCRNRPIGPSIPFNQVIVGWKDAWLYPPDTTTSVYELGQQPNHLHQHPTAPTSIRS